MTKGLGAAEMSIRVKDREKFDRVRGLVNGLRVDQGFKPRGTASGILDLILDWMLWRVQDVQIDHRWLALQQKRASLEDQIGRLDSELQRVRREEGRLLERYLMKR